MIEARPASRAAAVNAEKKGFFLHLSHPYLRLGKRARTEKGQARSLD
jgi:hypothetical protein